MVIMITIISLMMIVLVVMRELSMVIMVVLKWDTLIFTCAPS